MSRNLLHNSLKFNYIKVDSFFVVVVCLSVTSTYISRVLKSVKWADIYSLCPAFDEYSVMTNVLETNRS